MESIKLKNPIQINGKQVDELTYDINEITPLGFAEAEYRKTRANGSKGAPSSAAVELDYSLHLYLGFAHRVGSGLDGRKIRKCLRDYARVYNTGVTELEHKRLTAFLLDYAEAAEDLAKEAERRKRNMPAKIGKARRR